MAKISDFNTVELAKDVSFEEGMEEVVKYVRGMFSSSGHDVIGSSADKRIQTEVDREMSKIPLHLLNEGK